ncbi:IS5/IS1182 family transposase, partial [Lacticaseibacillus paracasei]|nr:IS5/IS1182 family transposase [Lacticaseibacillus paracasei]
RKQIKAQLQYIRRDLRYVDELLSQGGEAHLTEWQINRLAVVRKVYEQQRYMYDNKTHSVPDRIVSLSQPYIHPIVRGKAKARVEFGAKIDCSILDGVIDVERFDFESFNESTDLAATLDHCWDTLGQYPDEVLADTLYRTRANIALCKELGIKL